MSEYTASGDSSGDNSVPNNQNLKAPLRWRDTTGLALFRVLFPQAQPCRAVPSPSWESENKVFPSR